MKKLVTSLAFLSFVSLFLGIANAEQAKPQVTILHSSSTSNAGEAFSYPTGTPKLTIAQVIFPVGAQLPMHTHPAPLIVHVISGELTSERPSGEKVTFKAGDTFIEAPNSPHKVTNTGKQPTIVYGVFAGAEGMGQLTIPVK
jgi:quercetin dioxygenase-like cupin family protein|tara:strand:+ start:82 stop:507 length:426 start_codon:yes stop_codon:yes gene_type:complete